MKKTAYIPCFIDMSLYNNFNEESQAHELWEKIGIMFQNRNKEDKGTGVPKTGRSRGHGRSQGGGPLVSIAESRGTSRRTVTISERTRRPAIPI